jgi:uncharacterized membrane protein
VLGIKRLIAALEPSASQIHGGRRRWPVFVALVLALTAIHLFVNGTDLDKREMWGDEISTFIVAQEPVSELLSGATIRCGHFQPPLYYLLAHGLLRLNGPEWVHRGLSWVFCLLLIYFILFGLTEIGLFARVVMVLLFCLGGFTHYLAQEFRPYALAALTSFVATILLLRLLRSPRSRRAALIYSGATVAMLYTLALDVWVFAAHGLFLIFWLLLEARAQGLRVAFRQYLPVIVVLGLIALVYLPYLIGSISLYDEVYGNVSAHRRSLSKSIAAAFTLAHYKNALWRFAAAQGMFAYLVFALAAFGMAASVV